MQKYILLFLFVFFIGCVGQSTQNSHYTKEQTASLHLDSTTVLNIETDSVTTIDLNPFLKKQAYDLGALIEEVKFIPLETTDESLLSDIYKILTTDSYIYIYDKLKGGGLAVFDKEGKFVRRIPNGQGPGELIRLYDIAYDWENNELVAYQHSFLLFFTPSGEFIRQKRLPFGFYNFTVIPDGYVFKTLDKQGNGHLEQWEDYSLFITDKNFKLKLVALPLFPMGNLLGGYNYLHNNYNNTIKVTQKYNDTIYQYVDGTNNLKAKYTLDYSEKKLPEHYLKSTWDEFENVIRKNDYYFYIGEYFETESHSALFLRNWHTGTITVYRDKKSGNLQGGTYGICDGTTGMPSMSSPVAVSGNCFISVHFPDKNDAFLSNANSAIVSFEDKQKILNLMEDDNPVLVCYTLKDF